MPRLRVPQENEIRFVVNVTPVLAKTDSTNYTPSLNHADGEDEKESYENAYGQSSIGSFLSILKETNKLPKNLTPNNIDNGIKTLALILERLQREKQIQKLQGYTLTVSYKNINKKINNH